MKHVADKSHHQAPAQRMRQYLRIQTSRHPDRASLMLQRRLRKSDTSRLTREFLRIERGEYA
ncbi:hypothetical protein [Pelagovum pacificum]|uniref:Uncharacterized protein n=1 Tax=Pelagovum pacificum TaxID=2588711 RepID=A0A5C5GIX3_9RHOB|nr:hypothetical protein [Pelagovum pacificum]QQA43016.1 hypothetical protein I8N54_00090 [Pelagovum pacificum]TNY33839.1 hypothetical protein FHY64_11425 [Pelagovum pacificum]